MTSRCKSCGKTIIWAMTPAGKNIPVDVEPVFGGTIALDHSDSPHPQARFEKPGQTRLHKSHFATCPKAEQHRKPSAHKRPTSREERADRERLAYESVMRGQP